MKADTPAHTYMLYARVSPKGSDWNAEETSVAMQLQEMKEYISRRDPFAVFLEAKDEFKSGKNLNRPGIQMILADLENRDPAWGTLVVWALDRLSRSLADAVPVFEKLRDAGRGFICVRQDYLSTQGAMARFTLNQTILVAQLEREMTSERVKAKMVYTAEKGKVPGGKIPLGYKRKPNIKNEIEPDPDTVPVVQGIFADFIAQLLPVVEIKKKYSDYIYGKNQLYRLLRNRLYIGEIEYDGQVYPGKHPPIIDRAVFDRANAMLPGERRAPRPSRQIYKYLLQGLVYCHCGKKMTPYSVKKSGDTRYFYYKCQDTVNCKYAVNAERLDAEVVEQVRKIVIDPEYVKERYAEYKKQKALENAEKRACVEKAAADLAAAKGEMDKIEQLLLSGMLTASNAAYWNGKLDFARKNVETLQTTYDSLMESISDIKEQDQLSALLEQIREWGQILDKCDDLNIKRNLLLSVVQHIKCTDKEGNMDLSLVMIKGNKWRREGDSNPWYGVTRTTV